MTIRSSAYQRPIQRIAGIVLSTALAGLPLLIQPAPARAAFPGYNGKIAYQSNETGLGEIFVVNADGTGKTNLTNDLGGDAAPAFSPDGTKIAFTTNRDGNNEVYVMDADGSNQTNLTNLSNGDYNPTWSPDGTKIAFSRVIGPTHYLHTMNADGSDQTQLVALPGLFGPLEWSPDGTKIAFASSVSTPSHIWTMNADGTNLVQVLNTADATARPSWSPDGTRIVFKTTVGGSPQLHTVKPDGTDQQLLLVVGTDDSWSDWQPVPNQAPTTTNDSLTVAHNTAGAKAVLSNDTDEEALLGSNLSITVQPAHGSATVNAGAGIITYTPTTGYTGADSLTYQICDSFMLDQQCATAVLGITVEAAPPPDTTVPAKPTIISVGTVQINGASTVYYTGHRPTFTGTAVANAAIRVEINSDPIVLTTTADAEGQWSVTPDQDIPDGEHTVTITATKGGATSDPLTFVLGINTFIPETGADSTALRMLGAALLAGGVGSGLLRRRRVSAPRVPRLFP